MRKFITYTDRVLPVHHPRVVVETAVEYGAPREALFENSELTSQMLTSPDMRVSYLQYAILCTNALRLTANPALGLHIGRNTGIAQMGVLGFLLQNSPTLGAALGATLRYGASIAPAWEFKFERQGPIASLVFIETMPLDPHRRLAYEIVLAAFDSQSRTLYGGRPLPLSKVELPFPEPEHVSEYRALYRDVPLLFDQPVARVTFDSALLDTPIAFADPATAKLAEKFCVELIPLDPSKEGLMSQMRRILDNASGLPPTLDEIAQTLQTSSRSLRRELRNMGTSYQDLLDDSRRARAEEWMRTNSLPLEQLATTLGFSHVRSFRRAYKRWTGRTPGEGRSRDH